ncbi:MAG: 1-phosphofructokinase family hexose kinase [Anaerolineales bacterium]|nr:1-phosphofructokinase family hexose kinase [Anaerolineales bacterium]
MILTVTPNPSIDRQILAAGFRLGAIHRPQRVVSLAGGKGLNVARAIKRLGGEVHACALLCGHNGRWIEEQLAQEGIPLSAAWSDGETRLCTSIVDPENAQLTEIYENGPQIDPETWERFEAAFQQALPKVEWVTFSGSLPPGAPEHGYTQLLRFAKQRDIPLLVDTHGEGLRDIIPDHPWLVKVNAQEASEILGGQITSLSQAVEAAQGLCELGARAAIVTLGAQGAAAASSGQAWRARAPQVEVLAAVGSGDALLGGVVLGMARRLSIPESLRLGVAAGAANAATLGTGMIERETVEALLDRVEILER